MTVERSKRRSLLALTFVPSAENNQYHPSVTDLVETWMFNESGIK